MSMDIATFEEGEDGDDDRTTAELLVEFLLKNRDKAFRRKELAETVDRNPNTVGTNLSRLKDRGLVRHRKNHWALTKDLDRVRDAIEFSRTLNRLTDEYGPIIEGEEDARAWADAQPDQPHPSARSDGDETDGTEESTDER